ncbi:HEAT repeat domain-containing protein [Nocardioides sp. NPDC051685]|uniref:HEAT repeat domain-containing protein n=1 Tax=Nocardioides sp. NPDC051685 TaxID=3364334 RepID=UPI00378CE862
MTNQKVLDRLAQVGYPVASLHELRESGTRYKSAVPVLVDALATPEDLGELEAIVRALSVPWAKKEALAPLIDRFRSLPNTGDRRVESVRWAIGNAIEVLWDDTLYDELVGLLSDRRYGRAREMIVEGTRKSKRPEIVDTLVSLLTDPDVNGHAVLALARVKVPITGARPGLETMLNDDRSWVRTATVRALARAAESEQQR